MSKSTHSILRMTNTRCLQRQHLATHLVTRLTARALAKTQAERLKPIVMRLNLPHKMVYSRNDFTDNETIAMLEEEKNRPSSRFNADGEREGFGSFYDHPRWDKFFAEKTANIGHKDRVRTVDLTTDEQVKYRYDDGGDSLHSSEWEKWTGFTIKGTIVRGNVRNSSKRKPTKALESYNAT